MKTLIEDLKKVITSDIEDKDKYCEKLINGFLRERDSEQLLIQRAVKSLKDKEVITFEEWLKFETIEIDSNNIWINGVALNEDETLLEVYNEMK